MKLNSTLVGLAALLIACKSNAGSEYSPTLTSEVQAKEVSENMTWPMLPNENVNELAAKFYPNNKAMQRQFTFKTLRLNADTQPKLKADEDFEFPTAIIIPTLKSLSSGTHAINSARKKTSQQHLRMSYNIEVAKKKNTNFFNKIQLEYDVLVSKNEYLKSEISKLNDPDASSEIYRLGLDF